MALSHKGSWRCFWKHPSFSQWGGVLQEHRSISLAVPSCSGSTLPSGKTSCTQSNVTQPHWRERGEALWSFPGAQGAGGTSTHTPSAGLSTLFFPFSRFPHSDQNRAWLTRNRGNCPQQVPLTRWAVMVSKSIYLPLQWPWSLRGKQRGNEPGLRTTAWNASPLVRDTETPKGELAKRGSHR